MTQVDELAGRAISTLARGGRLGEDEAKDLFHGIMEGRVSAARMAAILMGLVTRAGGPTVDELTGAARVMREMVVKVEVPAGLTVVDTCGTGGDHSETFNISTAAALIAAGAGATVAKHGNRSVTSRSGSSQVLESLGVNLGADAARLGRCLREAGLCFCFAPNHHPAMKHASEVRRELGIRTIFNLLGPLTNPAGARRQVIGVYNEELTETIGQVLLKLGAEHALVVHGGGLDEISISGPTRITQVRPGRIQTYAFDARDLGIAPMGLEALKVGSVEESAGVIRGILAGEKGPARDVAALNAGAALLVADKAVDIGEGYRKALVAIDSGAAAGVLMRLVEITHAAE